MDMRIAKWTLIASAMLAAQFAPAQATAVHVSRCDDGSGNGIYTDGMCRALGATPTPIPPELLRELMHDGAMDGQNLMTPVARRDSPIERLREHPHVAECARTPEQLTATLREALGNGDVNQLATAYDWTGMSSSQAKPIMQRLQRMSQQPLVDGYYFDANDGVVQLVQNQGTHAAPAIGEFAVTQRAGCLFLQL